MRTAVVDVGGGLRGVYATGVLDRCLEEGVRFDAGVGILRIKLVVPPTSPPTWPGKRGGTTSFMRSIPAARST